jgi:hypothetical protein
VFNKNLDVAFQGFWMPFTLIFSVFAFTLLYATLVTARLRLAEYDEGREERELQLAIERRVRLAEETQTETVPA